MTFIKSTIGSLTLLTRILNEINMRLITTKNS